MKNKIKVVFVLVLLLIINHPTLAQDVAQLLSRKWKPDPTVIPLMVEDLLTEMRKKNPEEAAELETQRDMLGLVLSQTTFEYRADGVAESIVPIPGTPPQTGTWKLIENNTKIVRVINNKEKIDTILELTDKKLVFVNEKNQTIIFIPA